MLLGLSAAFSPQNFQIRESSYMCVWRKMMRKMEASMVQIDRTSSIEREPRTLSMQQMQSARDLAIYVLNTKTIEEASRIFTEGLKPVVSAACERWRMDRDKEEETETLEDRAAEASAFRDIASAPF